MLSKRLGKIRRSVFVSIFRFCSFDRVISVYLKFTIQVSNSSAIRYAQRNRSFNRVFCNRGTGGIDGSTSTAIGAAVAIKTTVFCNWRYRFYTTVHCGIIIF
jgi:2-succinyl-5-enolpyruvyl-6-hydroxy-3-cyclohexene-1-carboxylate synthase